MDKTPLYEVNYLKNKTGEYDPVVEIFINSKKIEAYADTGCSAGIMIFEEQAQDLDLGKKISTEPIDITVADGHQIEAHIYLRKIKIGDAEKEIEICVVNPTPVGYKPARVPLLLGRGFFDHYDVCFKGNERKLSIY